MAESARGTGYHHASVLCPEVIGALRPRPGSLLVDGTLGGGGHAGALLEAGAHVIGIDRDTEALEASRERLEPEFGARLRLLHGDFGDIEALLGAAGVACVDGIVLDLGVSSWQLDTAERGFSFQREGPLDMRMDRSHGTTAAELVNSWDEADLAGLFREMGGERQARRIAAAIARRRSKEPFATTTGLASMIEHTVGRRGRLHPATRVFQALRIAVNAELDALRRALDSLPRILAPGARAAIITFHSLEDRIVKHDFRDKSSRETDRPDWPAPRPNPEHFYRRITRKPVEPGEGELAANPRCRSARLRVVERLGSETAITTS